MGNSTRGSCQEELSCSFRKILFWTSVDGWIQQEGSKQVMKRTRNCLVLIVAIVIAGVLGLVLAPSLTPAFAQNPTDPNKNVPPFDFADVFYTQNGIQVPLLNCGSGTEPTGGRVGVSCNGVLNPGNFGAPSPPPFDANGQPTHWHTDTSNTDPTRTSTRLLQTTGGFDKDGNLIYYSIFGTLQDDNFFLNDQDCPTIHSTGVPDVTFTNCGTRAKTLANQFRAFISPRQKFTDPTTGVAHLFFPSSTSCSTLDPNTVNGPNGTTHPEATVADSNCASASKPIVFAPPPPNRRQDNVFDTQPTYFCQNLLGLWILTMDVWTPQAYNPDGSFASTAAQNAIEPLVLANGKTTDGTAVVERTSEIDSLTSQGFLQQFVLPSATHGGAPRYVV